MNPSAQHARRTAISQLRAEIDRALADLEQRVIVRDARAREQALQQLHVALASEIALGQRVIVQETAVLRRRFWGRLWWVVSGR